MVKNEGFGNPFDGVAGYFPIVEHFRQTAMCSAGITANPLCDFNYGVIPGAEECLDRFFKRQN
jgi:hypothetical protein